MATTLQLAREGTVQGIKDSQNDLRWFRVLTQAIRSEGLEDQFRMFLGTRILIDAAMVIGAHGAIPATSNVAPAAAAETWEAAARGDFAAAARAQEIVMRFEELAEIARGGSCRGRQLLVDEVDPARMGGHRRRAADAAAALVRRRRSRRVAAAPEALPHGAQRLPSPPSGALAAALVAVSGRHASRNNRYGRH